MELPKINIANSHSIHVMASVTSDAFPTETEKVSGLGSAIDLTQET